MFLPYNNRLIQHFDYKALTLYFVAYSSLYDRNDVGSATIDRLKHLKPIKHCGLNFYTRTRVSHDCNSKYDYKQSL